MRGEFEGGPRHKLGERRGHGAKGGGVQGFGCDYQRNDNVLVKVGTKGGLTLKGIGANNRTSS